MNANIKTKKTIALLATVSVLAVALISITLALLNQRSQAATNEFSGATVNIGVVEGENHDQLYEDGIKNAQNPNGNVNEFDIIKKNVPAEKIVAIKNIDSPNYPTSDTYVRVRLVPCLRYIATIQDLDEGRVETAGELVPVDMKGKVIYNNGGDLGTGWVKHEDKDSGESYYYYTKPLTPNQITSNLIESVTYIGDLPDNTFFELQVLTEGVSAKQEGAAQKAWGNDIPELEKPIPAVNTTTNP